MAYETLLLSDKATLVMERVDGGKIRVSSSSWSDPKVILEHEVIEARIKSGRIRIARNVRGFDPDDGSTEPCDPYGPGPAKAAPNDVRADRPLLARTTERRSHQASRKGTS